MKLLSANNSGFLLEADIDYQNADNALSQGGQLIADFASHQVDTDYEIDLSKISTISTVLIAVLVGWYRKAKDEGVSMHYSAVPDGVYEMARVCGVELYLPIKNIGSN